MKIVFSPESNGNVAVTLLSNQYLIFNRYIFVYVVIFCDNGCTRCLLMKQNNNWLYISRVNIQMEMPHCKAPFLTTRNIIEC